MRDSGVIAVGVTGHRVLPDPAGAARAVDVILDRVLGKRVPVVWTSLAEGADRLVAERVLARDGARLIAVLPLEPDDYAADFVNPESHAEFHRFLVMAERVEVVGGVPDPDVTMRRNVAYERAGRAVVDGVDLLIALWDGEPSRGRGGTAEVVAYARERGVDVEIVTVERAADRRR